MGRLTHEASKLSLKNSDDQDNVVNIERLLSTQSDNNRIVFLHSDVTEHLISSVIAQMLHLANINRNPIHMVVSTYGGSIDEMFALYDLVKFLPCPVHTVALGKVMSAGVLLLAAGVKGERLMGASSRIMIHPLSGGVVGNVFELQNETKEAMRLQSLMASRLVKETKMTKQQVEQTIMKPMLDYYLTPEQAVKFGIVDKIIGLDS